LASSELDILLLHGEISTSIQHKFVDNERTHTGITAPTRRRVGKKKAATEIFIVAGSSWGDG
jgi:hypothetical protein